MAGSSGELHDQTPAGAATGSEALHDGVQIAKGHCMTVTHAVVEQIGPDGTVYQETVTFDIYSCAECIERLNEYLDQELAPDEREEVMQHLKICRPCLERFDFERDLLAVMRDRIKRISAPGGLRSRLGNIIKQITVMLMAL